jgi:hypothetical protein
MKKKNPRPPVPSKMTPKAAPKKIEYDSEKGKPFSERKGLDGRDVAESRSMSTRYPMVEPQKRKPTQDKGLAYKKAEVIRKVQSAKKKK